MSKFYPAANDAIAHTSPEAPDVDYLPSRMRDQLYQCWWLDCMDNEQMAASWAMDIFSALPPKYLALLIDAALRGEAIDGMDLGHTLRHVAQHELHDEVAGQLEDHARDYIEDAGEVFVA